MRKTLSVSLSFLFVLSACTAPATVIPTVVPSEIPLTPTASSTSQVTATPVPFFTVYSDEPIVPRGQPGAWDDRYTDPGAVIYHDGMFHMFRNGFRGFPAESQVGYVTSSDGYTWTEQGSDPVFKTVDVPYAKIGMFASSALVEDDGTWVLYFYTWDSNGFPSASVIGRATASAPTGTWVADETPVLQPGAEGEWDEKQVLAPHVLKTEAGYIMYYGGIDATGLQQVGMATSSDGIAWTKYNDPATIDKPFIESDPVFQPGEKDTWDAGWVHQPRVFQTSSGWVMIYRGTSSVRSSTMKLGIATSADGIHWERYPANPVFMPRDIKGVRQFWFTNTVLHEDVIYLFVEGDINQTTQIYLATHQGVILP